MVQKSILYIDDTQANLFTLKTLFESTPSSYASFKIFTASSAQEGFEILLHESIDLILLDIMMPQIDGFTMAKMLQSNKKLKTIPIIFVTAKTDDETIEKCYAIGGSDYVKKPYNHIELLRRVEFHLKFKEKEKQLQKEKEYVQNILDLQDNFIIVTDGKEAVNVNKAVLDFYALDSLEEFRKQYHCICQTFQKLEGYFHPQQIKENNYWIDEIIKRLEKEDVLVAIKDKNGTLRSFAIKAKKFYDLYILTLTDITLISNQKSRFEHEANFDTLTQIYNRNAFYHLMLKKMEVAKQENTPLSFSILDIDHFKKVNDTYGHLVGDAVLKHLAQLIKYHIRKDDIFARWGGEEFIIALETDKEHAYKIIENLRSLIAQETFEKVGHITCSFGLTQMKKDDTIESITRRADEALYEAKREGRNRVCIK